MSGVFDKFMSSYVLLERRNLEELLQKLSQVSEECSLLPPSFLCLFLFELFQFYFHLSSLIFSHHIPIFSSFIFLCSPLSTFLSFYLSSLLSSSPSIFSPFLSNEKEEDTASSSDVEAHGNLYSSASSMFAFIKNSIKRCTALSNGQVS